MATKNKSNSIDITRIYDAPVKIVWEAWTDTKQVEKWWGPRGFSLTTHSKELKPGGHWHYTMHGPDGVDYVNKTKYFEVEKYSKLVYDHGGNDEQAPLFRVTVTFKEIKGKTHMDMSMVLDSAEAATNMKKFIKQAGGNSTWDRLAEYLSKETQGKDQFVINRTFETSIDVMYDMWTNPEHFMQWLAPTGMTMEFLKADIRAGGNTLYFMSGNGLKMYGRAHYLQIEKPNRIVYTQQFCDEKENISRHPMAPLWPETMLTTVELTSESADLTRVTVTWECYGDTTPAELAEFIKAKPGMTQGWTGSLDKLEEYLSRF